MSAIFSPFISIFTPNAVTSTALSFIIYLSDLFGMSDPSEPKSSMSGTVPRENASIMSAPLPMLPEDIANSHIAYIEPQGITPVSSPTMSGLAARRFLPAVTEQNELCCGIRARSPGSSPHIFMPMMATRMPTIVNTSDFVCIV